MLMVAIGLQWADAMTFAVIASVTADMSGELSPVVPYLGVGGVLAVKAILLATVATLTYHRRFGYRVVLYWASAVGAVGFVANSLYMLGASAR
jgi:hypothetical protein